MRKYQWTYKKLRLDTEVSDIAWRCGGRQQLQIQQKNKFSATFERKAIAIIGYHLKQHERMQKMAEKYKL